MAQYRYRDRQSGSQMPAFPIRILFGGVAEDLTAVGATLTFSMTPVGGSPLITDAAVTDVDSEGRGQYLPTVEQVTAAEASDCRCQWAYTRPTGEKWRSPIIMARILKNP